MTHRERGSVPGQSAFSDLRVWPEGIVLPPMWVIWPVTGLERTEDGLAYLRMLPGGIPAGRLPDDFYERELQDLDLSSEAEIAEFASRYGWFHLGSVTPDLTTEGAAEALAAIAAGARPEDWQEPDVLPSLCDDPAVLEVRMATMRVQASVAIVLSLAEFRLAVSLLRDMTRIVQADAGVVSFEAVLSEWESPLTFARPETREDAVSSLGSWIELGLSLIHPTVRHKESSHAGEPEVVLGGFDAVCVQLFNKIASGTGFRRCGNDRCNRVFGRQRSRAGAGRPGQWSEEATGLKFCSPACAQAQASRVRRDRIRHAARLDREGRSVAEIAADMRASEEHVSGWLAAAAKRREKAGGEQS